MDRDSVAEGVLIDLLIARGDRRIGRYIWRRSRRALRMFRRFSDDLVADAIIYGQAWCEVTDSQMIRIAPEQMIL